MDTFRSGTLGESLGWIGPWEEGQLIRRIEVLDQGQWYHCRTSELDAGRILAPYAVALYRQRERFEDARAIVRRLLSLDHFWVGAQNGAGSRPGRPGCGTPS